MIINEMTETRAKFILKNMERKETKKTKMIPLRFAYTYMYAYTYTYICKYIYDNREGKHQP